MPRSKQSKTDSLPSSPASRSKSTAREKTPRKTARSTDSPSPSLSLSPKTENSRQPIAAAKDGRPFSSTESGGFWKKPARQGETRVVAFVRDPQCLFTHWEVTPQSIEAVKNPLGDEHAESFMVLRVFKVGSNGQEELIEEIKVKPHEMNRYVDLNDEGGSYFVEVAQKTPSGRVIAYSRSNKVITTMSWAPPATGAAWDAPAGLLEYFAEEVDAEPLAPRGISSAEAQRRIEVQKQKKGKKYFASPF